MLAFWRGKSDVYPMGAFTPVPRVLAVLGPTNTGKTHLAIERMLGHSTGMIGFPLRLLARENYDRTKLARRYLDVLQRVAASSRC